MLHWIALLISGALEIVGVIALKKVTEGNKKFVIVLILGFFLSFSCISYAMQAISMGVAYAIWTGIGAAGGVIVGILFFGESKSPLKLLCVGIIIASSMGLKYLG